MSTRCNIHFGEVRDTFVTEANIYRHSDGYPEGVLPDLEQFFADVESQTSDHRYSDPSYLAAKFVVWQAAQNAAIQAYDYRTGKPGEVKPLDFISLGIVSRDAGDGEYIYEVNCSKLDAKGRPTVTHREA